MNNKCLQKDDVMPASTPALILIAAELYGFMNGAALVMEDGRELPITEAMIDECLQSFLSIQEN